MHHEDFFLNAKALFSIIGPQISKPEIDALFPDQLPGRDVLVEFYLRCNGGSRTELGGTVYCGKPEHHVSRDDLANLRVEGFFSISSDPKERVLGFRSMQACRATRLRTFVNNNEMKAFIEKHMPIAYDHSGNYLWIDLQSGRIRFLDWDAYQEAPVEIARSFRAFVERFWINAEGIKSGNNMTK